jgi:hypothetical protein
MFLRSEIVFLEFRTFALVTDFDKSAVWSSDWSNGESFQADEFGVILSTQQDSAGDYADYDELQVTFASHSLALGDVTSEVLPHGELIFEGVLAKGSGAISYEQYTELVEISSPVNVKIFLAGRDMTIFIESQNIAIPSN